MINHKINKLINKYWDSLVWMIIGIFILAILVLWISVMISNSYNIMDTFEQKKDLNTLKNNTYKIISVIDSSKVNSQEEFYLYKDELNSEFKIFTWSINTQYKYINSNWETINNIENYEWNIFTRVLTLEKKDEKIPSNNLIKVEIKKYK